MSRVKDYIKTAVKHGKKVHKESTKLSKSAKFDKVMSEWKEGSLTSGSDEGPKVTSQKQALAIAFSEARKARGKKKHG